MSGESGSSRASPRGRTFDPGEVDAALDADDEIDRFAGADALGEIEHQRGIGSKHGTRGVETNGVARRVERTVEDDMAQAAPGQRVGGR